MLEPIRTTRSDRAKSVWESRTWLRTTPRPLLVDYSGLRVRKTLYEILRGHTGYRPVFLLIAAAFLIFTILLPIPGSMLDLSWGASCRVTDTDYEIYQGLLGHPGSQTPVECSTFGATSFSIAPSAGDRFYLIVPANDTSEGSYGTVSGGSQRPASGLACLPQLLDAPVCP